MLRDKIKKALQLSLIKTIQFNLHKPIDEMAVDEIKELYSWFPKKG